MRGDLRLVRGQRKPADPRVRAIAIPEFTARRSIASFPSDRE
jgi:hypothetical protein